MRLREVHLQSVSAMTPRPRLRPHRSLRFRAHPQLRRRAPDHHRHQQRDNTEWQMTERVRRKLPFVFTSLLEEDLQFTSAEEALSLTVNTLFGRGLTLEKRCLTPTTQEYMPFKATENT
ncbi:hypothetical protein TGPRC2_249935 [Toxoplasma gondii TgCatPRC2]|uniref:Uncharacterized protein n=7 Tax=Toxoplasma gondii TaxID=5811 RepID=A0A125YQN1_TOXGV|nr:hypothetical protein TGME49_249935 [Toxoplasma gondii ME49]ESS34464.1 hypothetical protein TGVEG_249935 [Toxoplasma gondii VEG]KFG64219.1 hypothetical protein TGRUB_249935 [Toxoplasma gondii RUB]KFH03627.1 hypothetical protein TGMAS_249935 [Toxoplasma gondii MAS]KYF50125.1 hypothetical protein TGARI_249935 [Toxoplasma gondii ARI]KYK63954.1 hypothetical protein TGPRC2_249935 [Toxoplasma gondii TgCatPRC2]PUA90872.1 hypothetical protein TGBR9_249935 [Toxoplasma gondii TgCATBr9]|eukprot:XP_002367326.1 hypothetical protein TGME49_249935 [Toxoplasma gondii ME49]